MKKILFNYIIFIMIITVISVFPIHADEKTLDIAMILWRGETDAERGFKEGLKELGYKVNLSVWDAAQDRKTLKSLLKSEVKPKLRKYDYIYTFGTTVTKATRTITKSRTTPHIFNIVSNPEKAGIKPGKEKNVTGVSNKVPLDVQIESAMKVIPFKKLGFIYNPRENNSVAQRIEIEEISKSSEEEYQFEVIPIKAAPEKNELEASLNKGLSKNIDVLYLPLDSYLLSKVHIIGQFIKDNKVKSIGSQKKYITQGALIGFVADYRSLGREAAKIIDRHEKGEKIKNIPIYKVERPVLMINKNTVKLFNLDIPQEILDQAQLVD